MYEDFFFWGGGIQPSILIGSRLYTIAIHTVPTLECFRGAWNQLLPCHDCWSISLKLSQQVCLSISPHAHIHLSILFLFPCLFTFFLIPNFFSLWITEFSVTLGGREIVGKGVWSQVENSLLVFILSYLFIFFFFCPIKRCREDEKVLLYFFQPFPMFQEVWP